MQPYTYFSYNEEPIVPKPEKEFTLSAIHVMLPCSIEIVKGLKDRWYYLNNRIKFDQEGKPISVQPRNSVIADYYGKNISINAIVGVNGSGKSSLLEIIYRVINNLSFILNRGKRRNAADDLYYIDGLWAELYYVVNGGIACIACHGDEVDITMPGKQTCKLYAFKEYGRDASLVLVKDFIDMAKDGLFYTIVTNYSMQSFIADDFKCENVFCANKDGVKGEHKEDASWISGLFNKNDGYMTPLVLNPYRKGGMIDMVKEHKLSLYRLSSCFIHARNNRRRLLKDYILEDVVYTYNTSVVQEKILNKWDVSNNALWNYRPNKEMIPSYADAILNACGIGKQNMDWDNDKVRNCALYFVHKILSIAKRYPGYEDFSQLCEARNFFMQANSEICDFLQKLVHKVVKSHSHETLKARQAYTFLMACKDFDLLKKINFDKEFSYDFYSQAIGREYMSRSMADIQESLPPSFFDIQVKLIRLDSQNKRDNIKPITIDRLSSGERQYLYTFSTFIYHILNVLSIKSTNRVRYRRLNLILDEVEICFHPEYQRRFIDELIGYIDRMHMNTYASINIIIATHSPFILSDIMEENILYLKDGKTASKREDYKKPFCSNICDLLYQSFFLEEGFFGEYSRKKVKHVLRILSHNKMLSKSQIDYIKALAPNIGDDFLLMHIKQLMAKKGIEI